MKLNKGMKRALAMTAIVGTGFASWMMYKKKNPDALEDVKNAAKNAATKMLSRLENME